MATNEKIYKRGLMAAKKSATDEIVYPDDVRYEFQRVDYRAGWAAGVENRGVKKREKVRPDPVRRRLYERGYRHAYTGKPKKFETKFGDFRKHYLDGYYAGERRRESERQARMLQPIIKRDFDEHLDKKVAKKRREQ